MKKLFSIMMIAALMFVSSLVFAKNITVNVTCDENSVEADVKVWYVNPTGETTGLTGIIVIPDGAEVTQVNIIVPPGYIYVDTTRDGDVYTFILAVAP